MTVSMIDTPDPTGLWTSAASDVRKLLLPNGRYLVMVDDGERGQGDYVVSGTRIVYRGDNGETGTGSLVGGLLYSARGAVFYPEDAADLARNA